MSYWKPMKNIKIILKFIELIKKNKDKKKSKKINEEKKFLMKNTLNS